VTEKVLAIRNLTVTFSGLMVRTDVVRNCSLDVHAGEIVGLVGESGSGKSMTAMSCLGLVPKPGVTRGSVLLDNLEIVGTSENELNRARGGAAAMIFQNPMTALNPFLSIGEQITDAVVHSLAVSRKNASVMALDVLRAVHIPAPGESLKKFTHQLSGGQLKRIIISIANACKTRLLIADEPTTALDVTIQAQILLLIRGLTEQNGLGVLFITHDLSVVATLCDRVAVMYAGEIVESGTVQEVFSNPAHPYTRKLLNTVPVLGGNRTRLDFIPGQVPDMARIPSGCTFEPRCDLAIPACCEIAAPAALLTPTHTASCHLVASNQASVQ
jgi:peptide/nickel transport system ATP-binding protein